MLKFVLNDFDDVIDDVIEVTYSKLNDKKVKVFIRGEYYIPIYKSEYYKFFDNNCISKSKLILLRDKVINRAKKRVYYLLANREYTVYEIRTKLIKGGYHPDDISVVIDYFVNLAYLDDEKFAERYFNYYKDKKSLRQIKDKLRTKGIGRDIIEDLILDSDDLKEIQFELAYSLALSKSKRLEKDNFREKLYKYLSSKGYNYSIISRVLERITFDFEDAV